MRNVAGSETAGDRSLGILGAGKTTLLQHILRNRAGNRVAVIVNDMSELNIDARLVRDGDAALSHVDERLVEFSNGCICCTLREDLLLEVGKLAREGRFDYLLIESTGISEPMPVAETFTFTDEMGQSLSEISRLDTLVTVVDASRIMTDLQSVDELCDQNVGLDENDHRDVCQLLVDQIEFANVLVLNKVDLVESQQVGEIEALLRQLNPTAQIVRAERGDVPLDHILHTRLFSSEWAERANAWLETPRGREVSEADEYGFRSFVYRAARPFYPQRLWEFVMEDELSRRIVRSKGLLWLATRHNTGGEWSHAGNVWGCEPLGRWLAATPQEEWPTNPEWLAEARSIWSEPYGDRRQELVFIGQNFDEAAIRSRLDQCLLTDGEYQAGPDMWQGYEDPFDPWDDVEAVEEAEEADVSA